MNRSKSSKKSNNINLPLGKAKMVRTMQPTYRLNPKKRFDSARVEKILQRLVTAEMADVEYSDHLVPELCLNLADSIRTTVKEEQYDRYRILVTVAVGQRRQQSVQMYHSFLWDHERDGFSCYNYENCHVFVNVVVYGIYLD